jgi:hypothetical protein
MSSYTVEAKEYSFNLDNDVLKISSLKGTSRDEFDVTTIAHIQCVTIHEDSKNLGIILLILGVLLIILGNHSGFVLLATIIILLGVIFVFYKKDETTFQVTLQGIITPFSYQISDPPAGINELISRINQKRAELR